MSSLDALSILGHIEIFIDGYRPKRRDTAHFYFDPKIGTLTGGIDADTSPHQFEIGSREWWDEGWAIGDNRSNVPCLRSCGANLKRFKSYDDASDFTAARQKKHKDQRHVFVYVIEDKYGFEDRCVIDSAQEIEAIDKAVRDRKK